MGHLYSPASRYRFIDGLRGLAALAVVLHHGFAFGSFGDAFGRSMPHWFHDAAEFGRRGVQVFFVISGFVIAHALARTQLSPRSIRNFIARRQVRLNPAYWLCALLAFARLHAAWAAHPHELVRPRLTDLLINGLYLQRITGRPVLLGSSWTLCLEMQLYVVFVLILWIEQVSASSASAASARFTELEQASARPRLAIPALGPTLVLCLGFISVWARLNLVEDMEAWWFTQAWNLFALGVLTYWVVTGRCRAAWLWSLLAAVLAAGAVHRQQGMLVGATTAILIYVAARRRSLNAWLAWRPAQYLGTISYSLYLVHNEVLARMSRLGEQLSGDSLASAAVWTIAACLVSVLAAHVLYLYVERPTLRLAKAMKWQHQRRRADAFAARPAATEPSPAAAMPAGALLALPSNG